MNWADQYDMSYLAWSWEVPAYGSTRGPATNLELLSNWNGTPTVISRAGVAVGLTWLTWPSGSPGQAGRGWVGPQAADS
jgi:hypothetical protein